MKDKSVSVIKSIFNFRMLIVLFLGFSSGLPLLVTGSTLQAWMTDQKVDLALIGIFSLVGTPYTLKFLWSPIMDALVPPFMGRRRGWLIISQIALVASIVGMSFFNPTESTAMIAILAVLTSFFSASQDIIVDAYRREILSDSELGMGSSVYVFGYRMAMLFSGAFALFLADQLPWSTVYLILGGSMLIGVATTFLSKEPVNDVAPPRTIQEAVIDPFVEYFRRKDSLWIILFIILYKIGDNMASAMTTPFYLQLGFTKTDIAAIVKSFGLIATLGGGFIGGAFLIRLGIARSLWVFGILQAVSTAGFSLLAQRGMDVGVLTGVIAFENLTSGMGTSAYAAFMASLTNKKFTATQYALLSSLMGIPRVIVAAPTGYLAKSLGWSPYFLVCTVAAIPGILLLKKFARMGEENS